VSEDILKSRL
jgi:hypothetical protein